MKIGEKIKFILNIYKSVDLFAHVDQHFFVKKLLIVVRIILEPVKKIKLQKIVSPPLEAI